MIVSRIPASYEGPQGNYNIFVSAGDIVWNISVDGKLSTFNLGDISWVLTSVGNVFILAAGVGFFYSGLLRRKNSLSALYVTMASMAVVTIEVRRICLLRIYHADKNFSVVSLGFHFIIQ